MRFLRATLQFPRWQIFLVLAMCSIYMLPPDADAEAGSESGRKPSSFVLPSKVRASEAQSMVESADASAAELQADGALSGAPLGAGSAELVPERFSGLPAHWIRNNAQDAYRRALEEDKLLVLVFYRNGCRWCSKLQDELAASAELAAFSDCALFAISDLSDKAALAIAEGLGIKSYPSLSLLYPSREAISEGGRIGGYFSGPELATHFRTMLVKAASNKELSPKALLQNAGKACPALDKS